MALVLTNAMMIRYNAIRGLSSLPRVRNGSMTPRSAAHISDDQGLAALGRLLHLDARREGVLELVEVRDDQDLGEVILYQVDGLDQALPALDVLRAKALVDDQRLQPRPLALRQHLRQRQPDGEVHAESLATRVHLVGAQARSVADLDVE